MGFELRASVLTKQTLYYLTHVYFFCFSIFQ
jgi:hypothetical protein